MWLHIDMEFQPESNRYRKSRATNLKKFPRTLNALGKKLKKTPCVFFVTIVLKHETILLLCFLVFFNSLIFGSFL